MPADSSVLRLLRGPGGGRLELAAATVPGSVERVEILDGPAVAAVTDLRPPVDATAGAVLDLTGWAGALAAPVVVVHYRRPQPGSVAPAPLARASFRLLPEQIGEFTVQPTAPDFRDQPDPTPPHTPDVEDRDPFSVTFDLGTSRSVAGVCDIRKARNDIGLLPTAARAVVEPVLAAPVEPGGDLTVEIDEQTFRDPRRRADAWRAAFDCPPLETFNITVTGDDLSSDLVVDENGGVLFADRQVGGLGSAKRLRGVKQYLADLDAEIEDAGLTGREVFPRVYEQFADITRETLGLTEPFSRVNLTYPARLATERRFELRDLVRPMVPRVEVAFDEAVAAAGFFLFKRFGADSLIGVEAFKLQARTPEGTRAWEDPDGWADAREWHENLLVVDVGGGTTDCALIRVAVSDVTPPTVGRSAGRLHLIEPRLLSSGGRLHLGGDRLTLRIFELLKGALGLPDHATRWAGLDDARRGPRHSVFDALWQAAEQVKHAGLAGSRPRDVEVRVGDGGGASVTDNVVRISWPEDSGSDVTLPAEPASVLINGNDLLDCIGDLVEDVAVVAAGIARGGLVSASDGPAESVDYVMLSGGSMLSGVLRDRIDASLRSRFAADGLSATFELEFDAEYAKRGTAAGGAYLNAVREWAPDASAESLVGRLRDGRSFLKVDTSKLRVNLAADFHHQEDVASLNARAVFPRGHLLVDHGDGVGRAESAGAYHLSSHIQLHRLDVPLDMENELTTETLWASYPLDIATARLLQRAGVEARFEIDQEEQIELRLARGVPQRELAGPVREPSNRPPNGLVTTVDDVPVLASDLYVDVYAPGIGIENPERIAAAGTPVPDPGLLLSIPYDRYVYWRDPALHPHDAPFELLVALGPEERWLSIDRQGDLRVHPERPGYRTVDSPDELLTRPEGWVFARTMSAGTQYDPLKDPFNGTH